MATTVEIHQYLENHLDESLAELKTYCAQPSVAATGEGIEACAVLTGEMLRKRGFEVELIPTGGSPVVYGFRPGRSEKTLLFYNHYDVQPADPLELWDSSPFAPEVRDGKMYARGVSDDKGHVTSRLFALDALLAEEGDLPCGVKFLIEGEEEISSPHLGPVIRENLEKFAADVCIWEFGGVDYLESPGLTLGMRGICYVELSVETASQDAHSGLGGSIFPNAAWRLVWALRSIKGNDSRIHIPGFYENIVPPTERDIAMLAALPPRIDDLRGRYGVKSFLDNTEDELELRIKEVFEPSATICGLDAGYQGKGSKTVLPHRASAKMDFRLVPDQRPEDIFEKLRRHLDAEGFDDVHLHYHGGTTPARSDPDDPFFKLVIDAAGPIYDKPVHIEPIIGGSGPSSYFIHDLGLPVATSGVGHPGSQAHAPNENLRIDLYLKGAKHAASILKNFGENG
ncbi:MAG TPA: M20/M25/M40 family metallo-hydrolase [Anaerolineales bacterium]|nr:M20/M25/M40 family metallo-hydrolase [Anaerolineales bacterium]